MGSSSTTVALPSFITLLSAVPLWYYNQGEQEPYFEHNLPLLTTDQQEAYECFCSIIDNNQGGILLLDAPGGTGNTFLIKLILAKLWSEGKTALVTASSDIALTLLTEGHNIITAQPLAE